MPPVIAAVSSVQGLQLVVYWIIYTMLSSSVLGHACRRVNKQVVVSKANKSQTRSLHTKGGRKRVVTLIPGDGIGPEITASTLGILQAAGAPVEFERFDSIGDELPVEMLTRYADFWI